MPKNLRFDPPSFKPAFELFRDTAADYGYNARILTDNQGNVACQMTNGGPVDAKIVWAAVLEKHPEALKGCR
jgi:hypothetical protein